MAEPRKCKNPVREDVLWRAYVSSEEDSKNQWNSKWKWILDEYSESYAKLAKISGTKYDVLEIQTEPDRRSIKPIPENVNGEYGWICNLADFRLEKYGSDVDRGPPLPPICRLMKEKSKFR